MIIKKVDKEKIINNISKKISNEVRLERRIAYVNSLDEEKSMRFLAYGDA